MSAAPSCSLRFGAGSCCTKVTFDGFSALFDDFQKDLNPDDSDSLPGDDCLLEAFVAGLALIFLMLWKSS